MIAVLAAFSLTAQRPATPSSADLQLQLKKLNTTGSVLYLAAHPDDENTRLISWLANEACVRTGYLSLTRGDGGQNLIGTEKGALLGVVRTQELLAARRIDGGEQFFTRAVDFGYSKNPEETFEFWDKQAILADVVWVIRKFRPDVIITRFPPTERAGHGHHTASAMLAEEAFSLAADPKAFPEQLKFVEVWSPKSLYHNTSTWWYKDLPEKAENSDEYIKIDVGTYSPLLGQSYGEIASKSRSQHQSQGFGSALQRGSREEYLQYVMGEKLGKTLFGSFDNTWGRYDGMEKVGELLQKAQSNFDPNQPDAIVPDLMAARKLIKRSSHRKALSRYVEMIEETVLAACGIWLEAVAEASEYATGDQVQITLEALNRSDREVALVNVTPGSDSLKVKPSPLTKNEATFINTFLRSGQQPHNQYWLNAPFDGLFSVTDQRTIGQDESGPALNANFQITIDGNPLSVQRPVVYKWVDRAKGELYRPLAVLPAITTRLEEKVLVYPDAKERTVSVFVKNHRSEKHSVTISLGLPKGWSSSAPQSITFDKKGEEKALQFAVTPSGESPEDGQLMVLATSSTGAERLDITKQWHDIAYDHIPAQAVLLPCQAKLIRLEVATKGERIGYLMGAGDEVPQSLRILGYDVEDLSVDGLSTADLKRYDAIVVGIRAFNTEKGLAFGNEYLLNYVKAGGTVVVQYNTNRGLATEEIGPYPMKLSRDRVTDEHAAVTFLDKKHPILNSPNKLSEADFEGWVQERGLYFANEWDNAYTPLLGWHDQGEESRNGGLLAAEYGKGVFIYTGISFFRQLPAGVPGAYRLFANLVSAGKSKE